jgi:hypothetical protein
VDKVSLERRLEKLERVGDDRDDGPPPLIMKLGEHGHPTSGEDWTEAERAAASDVARERCLERGLRVVGVTREDVRTWLERHRTEGRRR